jgi:hypothetical protein
MTATVVPFPLTRRLVIIRKTAARMSAVSPKAAENILAVALQQQADAFTRKGIPPGLIAAEVKVFEAAIRAELWRLVTLRPGSGGGAA